MPSVRPIPWKTFEKVVLFVGCYFDREDGDHRIYKRADLSRPVVIPRYKELPVFIIKNNLRVLGIDTPKYLQILSEV